jgi:hypothetical protein
MRGYAGFREPDFLGDPTEGKALQPLGRTEICSSGEDFASTSGAMALIRHDK